MIAWVVDFSRVLTARLTLTRPVGPDRDEMHALLADPELWEHFPSLRHTDRARTAEFLRRQQRSWDEHGLGTWVARRPVSDSPGKLVGLGDAIRATTSRGTSALASSGRPGAMATRRRSSPRPGLRQHRSGPNCPSRPLCSSTTPGRSGPPSTLVYTSSGGARTGPIPTRAPCAFCTPTEPSTTRRYRCSSSTDDGDASRHCA